MAAAVILIVEKPLLILYYWTNPHQIWGECRESNMERNYYVKDAFLNKVNMAAATMFNFEKLLPFLHNWTDLHRI